MEGGWLAARDDLAIQRVQVPTGHFPQEGKWPVLFVAKKELRWITQSRSGVLK
jgi:hypothetical protein